MSRGLFTLQNLKRDVQRDAIFYLKPLPSDSGARGVSNCGSSLPLARGRRLRPVSFDLVIFWYLETFPLPPGSRAYYLLAIIYPVQSRAYIA